MRIEKSNCAIMIGRIEILLDPPHNASIEFDAAMGWPCQGEA
jgi:predicted GNAT superfamily acetyltransferase